MDTRKHTRVTPEWYRWIAESLAAGNTPASILATMRDNQFDTGIARSAISDALFGAAGPVAEPSTPGIPPVSRLAQGHVLHTPDRDIRVLLRIARPAIALLDGVLDDAECDQLMQMAQVRLERSAVVSPESGANTIMDIRTSEGAFFQRSENPLIQRIDARTAAIMGLSEEHGEGLQVMRYGVGGEYVPHFDYFPPEEKGSEVPLRQGGQRVSTLIMYLADVEAGGETVFPRIDFSYVPRKGQALYFEYTDAHGALDVLSLHGGAPVIRGEKWIVTKWMRERPFAG